jgi:hypothetical protein
MFLSEAHIVLLLVMLFFIIWLEGKQYAYIETFGVQEDLTRMSYIAYITFMFAFFGPIVWLGFLF